MGGEETTVALEFGVSKQQISNIRKKKDKVLQFNNSIKKSEVLRCKSVKLANDKRLDKALYTWFIQAKINWSTYQFQTCFFKRKQNISICS